MRRRSLALVVALGLGAGIPGTALAGYYCPPKPPPDQNCNSGRGNGSEGDSSQLIVPGTGSAGTFPTVDCDPGNSGAKNRGGD
jgi:hypothetical protein